MIVAVIRLTISAAKLLSNPYQTPNANETWPAGSATMQARLLARRFGGVWVGGVTVWLAVEFASDYLVVYSSHHNAFTLGKCVRTTGEAAFFAIPYSLLSIPLAIAGSFEAKRSIVLPAVGGMAAVVVSRTIVAYGLEVQAAVGLDNMSLFYFAAGCGAIAGYLTELSGRLVYLGFRPMIAAQPGRG